MPHKIVFFHPDLGIGGAERLVIDAAVGLQNRGHKVIIFTSHCDPTHCFDEARDGTLDVRVRGNSLIPPSLLGRFSILCAILRQLHLILHITLLTSELVALKPKYYIIDQLSAGIPLLRLLSPSPRVLFYCHFPDLLLVQNRKNPLKKLYRLPFDWLESWTTGCADTIVVNSKFTASVFAKVFPALRDRRPGVVYPCVDVSSAKDVKANDEPPLWKGTKILLSINRFERKKDVALAVRTYAALSATERKATRLVVAGGYDPRNAENASYHSSLCALADELELKHSTVKNVVSGLGIPNDIEVLFLLSVPNSIKEALLRSARLLVYTPRNEHFGIVPLEAMLAGTPVLAANEGGPTETVVDGQTGWLRDVGKTEEWSEVMRKVLMADETTLREMGEKGRKRVVESFSKENMAKVLEEKLEAMDEGARPSIGGAAFLFPIAAGIILSMILWWWLSR
ncbi:glycosyltransferase family 4 protein [Aulographum hederae CBS 113979]|uniref:Alpha-1,3/1,6-mannosyltransferase ALG2 n=1 Tax=Aulographum hederae CBS 113979 TaxID=1176131 RepID=A0A6G1HCM7_9PEZI|nr:glycosyltransferase family 4 protein [Aulographum hederae CBS 113979]